MSQRPVSASGWNTCKGVLNQLITDCNAVITTSYTGTITPSITLDSGTTVISRTVAAGDNIRAANYSDADGMVTKYNFMRQYDSCRVLSLVGAWTYNRTVSSVNLLGRRDASFPGNTPAYITPPVVGEDIKDIVFGRDILEIITDGTPIHRTTILGVAPGDEYVVINNCHSSCHGSCHGDCRRGKR